MDDDGTTGEWFMRKIRGRPTWVVAVALLTCAAWLCGAKKHEQELDALEAMLDAVDEAPVADRLQQLADGVHEIARTYEWPIGRCELALAAVGAPSMEARSAMLAVTHPNCNAMCPTGPGRKKALETLRDGDSVYTTEMLVEACDASGEESVFAGPLSAMRDEMPLVGYWGYRTLFVLLQERLTKQIRGDRAETIWAGCQTLIPWVADRLANHSIRGMAASQLVTSTTRYEPEKATTIFVTSRAIYIDYEPVLDLTDDHEVPAEALRDGLIEPLLQGLEARQGTSRRAIIGMGADREFGFVKPVLHTVHAAGLTDLELAVKQLDEWRMMAIAVNTPPGTLCPATDSGGEQVPAVILTITAEGYVATAFPGDRPPAEETTSTVEPRAEPSSEVLEKRSWSYPYSRLTDWLSRTRSTISGDRALTIAIDDAVKFHVVIGTLDAAREYQPPEAAEPVALFEDVVLVGTDQLDLGDD
jgi:hypothetical protein